MHTNIHTHTHIYTHTYIHIHIHIHIQSLVFYMCVRVSQPLILREILLFVSSTDNSIPLSYGYIYAIALGMYVCMYVWMYVCIYGMYVCMVHLDYTHAHICILTYVHGTYHVCIHTYIHTYIHTLIGNLVKYAQ